MASEDEDVASGAGLHRIPVIDKMMRILETIEEAAPDGLGIGDVVAATGIARSTVYRVLNTLTSHGILVRSASGDYALGFRLVSLAGKVKATLSIAELVGLIAPHLNDLAERTEETCKLSYLDSDSAVVAAVAASPNAMAPISRVGSRFELHSGAASKLLLAFAPEAVVDRVLSKPLHRYTSSTLLTKTLIAAELKRIRSDDLSFDHGEWNINVNAVAAPVRSHAGEVIAALSVTYFATLDPVVVEQRVVPALKTAARNVSLLLGYAAPVPGDIKAG